MENAGILVLLVACYHVYRHEQEARTGAMSNFWQELKHRKVVRVAVIYLVAAWIAVEVGSVLIPSLLLPDWTLRLMVALALIGFPVVVVLAWTFDITPGGIRETPHRDDSLPSGIIKPLLQTDESFSPADRLDGWKRIASHLHRDVRTVRRWEKTQDLPVRRVMHQKGATVYAYRPDLEAWLAERDQMAPKPAAHPIAAESRAAAQWIWPIVTVAAVVTLIAFWWMGRPPAYIDFTERDWVLITQFDNRTGQEVLDGTLEYALERELNNSRFVKVIARNRVNDVLRLMSLPTDTQVNLEIGREISLRDGAVRILITGRIDRTGDTYALSANLVNPADGVVLASLSSIARSESDILLAVAKLAGEVRGSLGEELSSIQTSEIRMSPVTTPSLQALQLYSKADAMMSSGTSRPKALAVLQQALRTDPDFASAHLLMAYLYKDQDNPDEALIHLERALELADTASERERLFILSTGHSFNPEEYEQSIEVNEILVGIFPDHFWAVSNLASANQVLGRYDQVYRYRLRRAELRPNVGWSNLEAIFAATLYNQPEIRTPFLERAEQLAIDISWVREHLRMLPFYETWLRGDLQEAKLTLDRIVAETGEDVVARNGLLSDLVRSGYLALGQLEEFRRLSSLGTSMGWMGAILEIDSGNLSAMDDYLKTAQGHYGDSILLARAGRTNEAEAIISSSPPLNGMPRPYFRPNFKYLARGELALARGQVNEAISQFEQGLVLLSPFSLTHYLFALNSLAKARLINGNIQEAINTLERGRIEKDWTIFEPGANFMWQRNERFLIQMYKRSGQNQEAKKAADALRELLALADSSHLLLTAPDEF